MSDEYADRSDEEREWAVRDREAQGDVLAAMVDGTWLDAQEFPPLEYAVDTIVSEGFGLGGGPAEGR